MLEAFALLREHEVQVLTVGPVPAPVREAPAAGALLDAGGVRRLEREAYAMGFESVASGPLVRSSYHADEQVPVRRASGLAAV